jgi:Toprim domain
MTLTALRPTQDTINLVAALRGTWHGAYAMCRCPAHDDRTPSLSIRQGISGVLVHCFAGCNPRDIMHALRKTDRVQGIEPRPARSLDSRRQAQRLWDNAIGVHGTLGERYLIGRCLPLDLPDIRFHPRCPLGRKPDTAFHQALIVAVRERGRLVAVQRIILDPRSGRHRGKFLLGSCGQGAWQPPLIARVLAIAEGFEDAAAFTSLTGVTCWAAMGASRLPMLSLPETLDTLIIAEDNDACGRRAAANAVRSYRRVGLDIIRQSPSPIMDWAMANERNRQTL